MVIHSQKRVMNITRIKPRTLTLEDWFEAGLDLIKHEGHTHLSIGGISAWLGVTKGAFYYHFNDKAEFESALLEHYLETTAFRLAAELSKMESPQMRLKAMLMTQVESDSHRLCLIFRAWGLENPDVARALKKLDQFRLTHANYMFQEFGFSRQEAALRARMLVTLIQGEAFIYSPLTKKEKMEQLELRYQFFLK